MAKKKSTPTEEPQANYTVLARRYRPLSFADLVGQEPVAEALTNALKTGRVAHAYLFTGLRGVGKTSTARILAKALNCEKGPTPTPCNECENCKAIASGEDMDVLEIDGASNNGVEHIRELRSNVQFRPSRSRYKIYIIDEVHMLSASSFNALLKTLEEPPPHVKFIFATTVVEKIPITILSRCQRFDFVGIGTPGIVQRLKEIVASEKMQADEEALELVARRAGGSMRDAQSLLDQLLAFGVDRLTVEQVHRLLGTASDDRVAELACAVLAHDAKLALELFEKGVNEGQQLGELVDQLMAYWRDLMVVQAAGPEAPGLSVGTKHKQSLVDAAQRLTLETLLAGLDILSSTRGRLRTSNQGRVLVEMALVRLGRLDDLVSLSQLVKTLAKGQVSSPTPAPAARPNQAHVSPNPASTTARLPPSGPTEALERMELTADSLPLIWSQVLAKQGNFLRTDLEKAGLPAIFGPNTLELRFPPGYNVARDRCLDSEAVGRIEQLLQQLTGRKCQLRIESSGPSSSNVPSTGIAGKPEDSQPQSKSPSDEAAQPPLVKWAKDLLGAKPIKADPGFGASVSVEPERKTIGDAEE